MLNSGCPLRFQRSIPNEWLRLKTRSLDIVLVDHGDFTGTYVNNVSINGDGRNVERRWNPEASYMRKSDRSAAFFVWWLVRQPSLNCSPPPSDFRFMNLTRSAVQEVDAAQEADMIVVGYPIERHDGSPFLVALADRNAPLQLREITTTLHVELNLEGAKVSDEIHFLYYDAIGDF